MAGFKYRYRVDSFTEDDELTLYGQVLKVCTKCHHVLCPNDFYKSNDHKSGLTSQCKKCTDERVKAYSKTENGKEVLKRAAKKHNETEGRKKYVKEYAQSDKFKSQQKVYRSSDQYRETVKKYWKSPKYKEKRKEYGRSDTCRRLGAKYRQSDKYKERLKSDGYKEKARSYRDKRLLLHQGERLRESMARGLHRALKGNKNGRKWEDLVGYTLQDLMACLEKQFIDGMSWDNYGKGKGKWTIDHIIPQSVFGYIDSSDLDFQRCWALENLRPMWGVDNIAKGDKIIEPFQPSLDVILYKGKLNNKTHGIIR